MPKLAKLEDWTAPWETETGTDQEIDKARLKKYLHNLLSDKEKLQESVAEKDTKITDLQGKVDAKAREGESEMDKLKRENKELQDKIAAGVSDNDPRLLRLEVAMDKGLTAAQAKRLVGNTKEELETDADELIQSFGGQGKTDESDTSNAGDNAGRRQPARRFNPGDRQGEEGPEVTLEKALEAIPRLR